MARQLRSVGRNDTKYAQPEDVEREAAKMAPEVLACRTYRHYKEEWDVIEHEDGSETVVLRCFRCKHLRWFQEVNAAGDVVAERGPLYEDGYLLKGFGRVDGAGRSAFRRARLDAWKQRKAAEAKPATPATKARRRKKAS